VGTPARAEALAARFDAAPAPFRLGSERAFLTLTGRVRGVPVSVASIGMGFPNVDFFLREARECVDGDMVVVRCVRRPFCAPGLSARQHRELRVPARRARRHARRAPRERRRQPELRL
jgi:hypothetical protein